MRRILSAPQRIRKHQKNDEGERHRDLLASAAPTKSRTCQLQIVRRDEVGGDVEDKLDGRDQEDETLLAPRRPRCDQNRGKDGDPEPRLTKVRDQIPEDLTSLRQVRHQTRDGEPPAMSVGSTCVSRKSSQGAASA